jgi:hypothetical protein
VVVLLVYICGGTKTLALTLEGKKGDPFFGRSVGICPLWGVRLYLLAHKGWEYFEIF